MNRLIINILFIALIFILIFSGQHTNIGRFLYSKIMEIIYNIWGRIQYLFNRHVLLRVNQLFEEGKQEIETQQATIFQNFTEKVKNQVQRIINFVLPPLQN